MIETVFIFFLLSGIIKPFLFYFHISIGIDFTLLTALLLIGILVKNIIDNQFIIRMSILSKYAVVFIFALFTLILLSLLYTSSQQYVYTKTIQFFTIILGFLYPILIQNFSIERFFKLFIIIVILLTILFLPLFITGYKSFSTDYTNYQNSPLSMIYQSYQTMGYLISLALIVNIFHPILIANRRILVSLFLFGALLVTGARGALFGFIIVMILFLWFKRHYIKKLKMTTLLGILLVLSIGSAYLSTQLNITALLERTYNRIVNIKDETSANARVESAKYVFNNINTKHLALGYGFGSYGYEHIGQDIRSYPHNMILEILFELGVIGVFIYGLFILIIIKHLINVRLFLLSALFIFLFLNSLKSLSLSDSRIYFGFLAILLISNEALKRESNEK